MARSVMRWFAAITLALAVAGGAQVLPAHAQSEASPSQENRLSGIRLEGDEPILIESNKLEVRENDNIAIFSGDVSVVQGNTLLKAKRLVVHYADDGGSATTGSANIERIEAEGKVYVKSDAQVATGDRGTYDMKTEVMVLTGKTVVLTEGENSAVGCKLTIEAKTGQAHLESCKERVKILITPKSSE